MKLELVRKLFHLVGPFETPQAPRNAPNTCSRTLLGMYMYMNICKCVTLGMGIYVGVPASVHFSVFDFNDRGPLATVYSVCK